jgi:hypothetical protein
MRVANSMSRAKCLSFPKIHIIQAHIIPPGRKCISLTNSAENGTMVVHGASNDLLPNTDREVDSGIAVNPLFTFGPDTNLIRFMSIVMIG